MNTTLIIMAAGIGSRYGKGIKQLAKIGPHDEIIMDYSIYDAIEAGFNKVVFIIRKDIEKEFSINRSTTSEMLKLMCKKGMIEREEVEYDARLKKIVLTESSRNHNRQIEDKMKEMHQKLIKDLSEEEINTFIKISDKLINNIKEDL